MSNDGLHVNALPAAEMALKLASAAPAIFEHGKVDLDVKTNIGIYTLSLNGVERDKLSVHEDFARFIDECTKNSLACTSATLKASAGERVAVEYSSTDQIIGRFTLNHAQGIAPAAREFASRAIAALNERFKITPYVDLIRAKEPAESAAMQLRERSVADLVAQVDRLAQFLTTLTEREAETRRKLQEDLERSYRDKQAALEAEFAQKRASEDERQREIEAALKRRLDAHAREVEEFKTREAKHRRRALLDRIEDVLKSNFSVSKDTAKKRIVVHVLAILLLAVAVGLGALYLYQALSIPNGQPPLWRYLGPLAAATATFVTTMVYYLKWNDRFFREHADAEFAANRYKADILRASWVAELVSEWLAEKDKTPPPELLGAFTKNLFPEVGPTKESEHALDSLTGVLKRASKFSIGKDSLSVEAAPPPPPPPAPPRPGL